MWYGNETWCSVDHISQAFLFRAELYSLSAVGYYVEGSGLDRACVEAEIYSVTTVYKQFLKGKHMYRALECHSHTNSKLYPSISLLFMQVP